MRINELNAHQFNPEQITDFAESGSLIVETGRFFEKLILGIISVAAVRRKQLRADVDALTDEIKSLKERQEQLELENQQLFESNEELKKENTLFKESFSASISLLEKAVNNLETKAGAEPTKFQ